jgi:hypothetical protein
MALTIPRASLAKLSALRGREHLFHILWAATRWLALAITLFAIAMIIDWRVDRVQDTPLWARRLMSGCLAAAFLVAGWFWLLRPLWRRPRLIPLAKRVEEQIPEFDHRLVTAIQLTRPDARVEGMSPALIEAVARETERIVGRHDLVRLADTRRLKWSAALAGWPLALVVALLVIMGPALALALAGRQLLFDTPIPHDIQLTSATRKNPWPAGDEVTVRYEVASKSGGLRKEMKGVVAYENDENHKPQTVDLVWDEQTEFTPEKAIFKALVPQSTVNFSYRARLGDGRTGGDDRVTFEPRPQATIEKVWVQSPAYIPDRPETEMSGRAITAFNGSRARVKISVQKPIAEAKVTLYAPDDKGKDLAVGTVPMTVLDPEEVEENGRTVTVYPAISDYFELWSERKPRALAAYRVSARDRNGFDSVDNPRGTIRIAEPKIPEVTLLEERFTPPGGSMSEQDTFLKGLPVPLGEPIRVEYYFRSSIGARDKGTFSNGSLQYPAYFVYQINDETEGPNGPPRWTRLPLSEVEETPETGVFDFLNAHFTNIAYQNDVLKNRVEFTACPTREPGKPSRTEGGGVFNFETAQLRKLGPNNQLVPLEVNDRVKFFIEVYDRDPALGRKPGESDIREKTLATKEQVFEKIQETLDGLKRIQEIQKRSQGLFAPPKKSDE